MMTPDIETCVERATRPLEKHPELHATAKDEIRTRIVGSGASDEWVGQAAAGFERADRRGILRHWKILLYAGALATLVAGMINARRMKEGVSFIASFSSMDMHDPSPAQPPAQLSAKQILLLYGRRDAPNESERWKALWQSDPNNPAYFAEYVTGVFQDTKSVSDEILHDAEQIDPDNGWYPALKAASLLKDNVERKRQSDEDREALLAPEFTVKDESRISEAIALLHEAAAKPEFNSHDAELMRQRITVMGQPVDWLSYIPMLAHMAGHALPEAIAMREFSKAMAVEADRCAEHGDKEGFLRLVGTWESLTRKFLENGFTMVEMLVGKVMLTEPATSFRDAAIKLDLDEQASRFEALAQWQKQDRDNRKRKRDTTPHEKLFETRSSMMAYLTLPMLDRQVRKPPAITAEDLRPMRHVEHAFFLRLLCASGRGWLGLAVVIAAVFLGCTSMKNRLLSRRICDLLQPKDWLLILFGGTFAAILSYGVLVYLTPFGTRDWSIARSVGIFQLPAQFTTMLILMMTLTAAIASWRCDLRLAPMTGASKFPILRWIMAGSAFLAMLLLGSLNPLVHILGWKGPVILAGFWLGCTLAVVPLGWLLICLVKPLFDKRDASPRSATLIRMVLPGYMVGFISLFAVSMLLHLDEKHWMAKDRLMQITPEAPSMSRHEWELTQILRGELIEHLTQR